MSVSRKSEALSKILDMITSGEYKQGEMFSESKLVEKLGLSRTPIREALSALVQEGLVEQIPQVGTRVKEFTKNELSDLFMTRELLKPITSINAINKITNEQIAYLSKVLLKMDAAAHQGDVPAFLENDVEFHWKLAEFSDLPLTRKILLQIGNRIRVIGLSFPPDEEQMSIAVEEHKAIFDAITLLDKKEAAATVTALVNRTNARLEKGKWKENGALGFPVKGITSSRPNVRHTPKVV